MRIDDLVLTIDPARQFGRVCIDGTRIPAEVVAECVYAGDSVSQTADAYDIGTDDVLLACWWFVQNAREQRSRAAKRIVAAWDKWADEALMILGGHKNGICPEPPEVSR